MEFDRDPNGYFRYTRLTLEFDWQVPGGYDQSQQKNDEEDQESTNLVISQISTKALPLVNHFVDVYRTVTDDVYIERITCVGLSTTFALASMMIAVSKARKISRR